MKTVHEFQPKTLSCGPCLPSTITNLVCSCWNNSEQKYVSRKTSNIRAPLLSMCTNCPGCKRYFDAWDILYRKAPQIRIGSRTPESLDDNR